MNLYRSLGSAVGTPEAIDLGVALQAWHDAMVAHERRRRARGEGCDDGCPHAEARILWRSAVKVFGERSGELLFLARHGAMRMSPVPTEGGAEVHP